jgi:2'-hydroxyisoflavone reductase
MLRCAKPAERSIERAVAHGLTFRPLADTVYDVLRWHHARPEERRTRLNAGITEEQEAAVLRAWTQR